MQTRPVVLAVLAVAASAIPLLARALTAEEPPPPEKPALREPPAPPGPAPRGLELVATLLTPTVQPGAPIRVKLELRNGAEQGSIPVVRPGDGSESGWREPWIRWDVAYVGADGAERPLRPHTIGRCGMFDADWRDEVTTLRPGESVDVTDGAVAPLAIHDLQEPGTVRIRAWYSWGAGAHDKRPGADPAAPKDLGAMKDTPAFDLASNPVTVTVVRPIDVVVRVKRAPKVGRVERPEQFLEVEVRAADGNPFALVPDGWTLTFECESAEVMPDGWEEQWSGPPADEKRAPRASYVLTDAAPLVRRCSFPWKFEKPGRFRVAARLSETRDGSARIRSAWTDVAVEK